LIPFYLLIRLFRTTMLTQWDSHNSIPMETTVSTPVIALNDVITNAQMAAMPKSQTEASMKIRFKITSVRAVIDQATDKVTHHECNVVFGFQFPGQPEKAVFHRGVKISRLLNWNLRKNMHPNCMYAVGTTYQSLNLSPDTKANPIQAIQWVDKATGELKFYLACVFENNQKVPRTAPDGSTYYEWIDSKRSKSTYRRWRPIRNTNTKKQ